jgi:hypothetical protein
MKHDSVARAAWKRAQRQLRIVAQMLRSAASAQMPGGSAELDELTRAVREALRATDRELEAAGFEAPRTLEEWEHLALLAEMPFETIQSGNLTLADVRTVALAWADRERMKARIAAEAKGAGAKTIGQGQVAGDGDESESPALTATEIAVLQTLATFDPSVLASAARIEMAMESDARFATRSILPAVRRLIELGLAERPQGIRSGARLTLAGRRLARKIAG